MTASLPQESQLLVEYKTLCKITANGEQQTDNEPGLEV